MIRTAFVGARILAGSAFLERHAVIVQGGLIEAILPETAIPGSVEITRLAGGDLLPGFIDCQVNGGAGVLFNDSPSVEGIAAIGAAHRRFGTTGFFPTLISDDLAVVDQGIDAVDKAIARGIPGVLGLHLEGPYLNSSKAGIHDRAHIRRLEDPDIDRLLRLRRGKTIITLAPECVSSGTIQKLTGKGAIVCAGHTAATYSEIQAALGEGLRGFTHLFNAMSPFTSREPGVVGAALNDSNSWCGLIADLHHVHPASISVALRAKPIEKFFLVTDAMPTVGWTRSRFVLGETPITESGGRLTGPDGTLAGAHLDMAGAVRNMMRAVAVAPKDAVMMASASPAAFLGMGDRRGRIAPGLAADFVHVNQCSPDGMDVLATWIGGVRG